MLEQIADYLVTLVSNTGYLGVFVQLLQNLSLHLFLQDKLPHRTSTHDAGGITDYCCIVVAALGNL
jgi:hypothetical protein